MRCGSLGDVFVAIFCLLVSSSASSSQADATLIRVYVDSRPAPGDDLGLSERQQSGKDLATAIASKKKLFTIVEDEDKADVVIELKERTATVPKLVIGIGPRPGQAGDPGTSAPSREAQLRVAATLAHAEESIEIKNKNRAFDNPGGWKSAAEDIAKQVEKWVSDRRAKILAARPKAPQ